MIAAFSDHLWQSTLFAACIGLLTLTLRSNSAGVRYWLWFAASVKFLVPFSLQAAASGYLVHPISPTLVIASPAIDAMQQVALPFSATLEPAWVERTSLQLRLVAILFVVWAVGFAAYLVFWRMRWSRIKAALRTATPLSLTTRLPLPVKSSASVLEPGLVGIWRPVLLLPEGIETRLSAHEMDAILAHELCHMRRRDNLTVAIHMLVEATFWFYPLVWWLGARLIAEREHACDESVLASGRNPQVYAESILKICRFYVQSPLACASGVSGADLKQRVVDIMRNRVAVRLNASRKILLATSVAVIIAVPLLAGFVASHQAAAQTPKSVTAPPAPDPTAQVRAAQKAPRTTPESTVAFNALPGDLSPKALRLARSGQDVATTPTPDKTAQKRAAQAAPRTTPARAVCKNPPTSRYVLKAAEVYDTQSQLTWARCSFGQRWQEGVGCVGEIKQLDLGAAMEQAAGGWRLPTRDELMTLISPTCRNPAINQQAFPDMDLNLLWYWTSTGGASSRWRVVGFEGGDTGNSTANTPLAVRLVRGGQALVLPSLKPAT